MAPLLKNVYEHAYLVVKTGDASEQNRYAKRNDDGEFLFATGTAVSKVTRLARGEKLHNKVIVILFADTAENHKLTIIKTVER